MRVIEIFGEPISHGGQEAFIFSVLEKINMQDLQIDFFTPYYADNSMYEAMIADKGGKLFAAGLDFVPGSNRKNIVAPLAEVLKSNKYDVAHIHSGSISVLAYAAETAKKSGVPKVIVHSHADGLVKNLKYRISRLINGYRLNNYPDIYCACSKTAGEWKFSRKVVENKLIVLKNGIDVDRFHYNPSVRSEIRDQLGVDSDEILIGQVGRLSRSKNHAFSIEILKGLRSKSDKYKMVFVGDGEIREEIESLISESGLKDQVILVGNVNNVQDYLSAMDVFIFPSLHEGFGIVAVEAQATGLPVIASDTIPHDVDISGRVKFEGLDDAGAWVYDIEKIDTSNREDGVDMVVKLNYDSVSVSESVRELYFK